MASKRAAGNGTITIEDFIRAWQGNENVKGVSEATGLTVPQVHMRASRCRKHGVTLKSMRGGARGSKVDWEAAKELAQSLAE